MNNKKFYPGALMAASLLLTPLFALADQDMVCVSQQNDEGVFEYLGQVAVFDGGGQTAAQVYDYVGAVGSSYNGVSPSFMVDVSQLFLTQTSEGVSLFMVHDAPGGGGGDADVSFTLSGDTAAVLVEDDPSEPIINVGGTGFSSSHAWADCCTDGGVIGALDGSWSMLVDLISFTDITTWQVTSADDTAIELDMGADRQAKLQACAGFTKEILEGPDMEVEDDVVVGDGNIDAIIAVKQEVTTPYVWSLTYDLTDTPSVMVTDTAPAEWIVTMIDGVAGDLTLECGESTSFAASGELDVYRGGKAGNHGKSNKKCHSSTHFAWWPEDDNAMFEVSVETRPSPGKGHKNPAFAPTSCGALYLNDGAMAFAINPETDEPFPEPLFVSNQLCVAAVKDPTEFGFDADNDEDGIPDHAEACTNEVRTDPCMDDTDGDEILDGVDNCPLDENNDQLDTDQDGMGDVCDDDIDGDGILNDEPDNCPLTPNPGQEDTVTVNGVGDACDDTDVDGIFDDIDVCPLVFGLDGTGCPI